jgi:hypothetical protein
MPLLYLMDGVLQAVHMAVQHMCLRLVVVTVVVVV